MLMFLPGGRLRAFVGPVLALDTGRQEPLRFTRLDALLALDPFYVFVEALDQLRQIVGYPDRPSAVDLPPIAVDVREQKLLLLPHLPVDVAVGRVEIAASSSLG